MARRARIFVCGHRGMVGSAIVRALEVRGDADLITRSRAELDLTSQQAVADFFAAERPTQVYLAAAKVGGIHANNTYPAEFIYDNLMIQANVVRHAWESGVERLLFLGSSCIYPRLAPQPMPEGALLTGALEPTNEPYAIAKIAGIKLCESYNRQYGADFRSVMPTNLYGPGDYYHAENSHVIPALIRRFREAADSRAAEVEVWGSGNARREFLHVDDMARASIHVMDLPADAYRAATQPMQSHINIGTGEDVTIRHLAESIGRLSGYTGEIRFNASKPDGAPRKLLDTGLINSLGWRPSITLEEGLASTIQAFAADQLAQRRA